MEGILTDLYQHGRDCSKNNKRPDYDGYHNRAGRVLKTKFGHREPIVNWVPSDMRSAVLAISA